MHRLPQLDLFAKIDASVARQIIAPAHPQEGKQGDRIAIRPVDYFVLLQGEALLARQDDGRATVKLRSDDKAPPDWLYAIPPGFELRLAAASRYVILDGKRIDAALDDAQADPISAQEPPVPNPVTGDGTPGSTWLPEAGTGTGTETGTTPVSPKAVLPPRSQMKRLTDWLRRCDVFARMNLYELVECASALQPFEAGENWDVVRAGSEGNFFYLIETGSAEVWRSDPPDEGEPVLVATLHAGDSFGEEALLQGGARNATVRMREAGRLWRLEKAKFDELVRDALLKEIDADEAIAELNNNQVSLIDCRYGFEHDMIRIPGSTLLPLNDLRAHMTQLDKTRRYLVYCRSGLRSRAAAFLLQRAGFDARSMRGGLTAWPGDIEHG